MPTFEELLSHARQKRQAEPARADSWDGHIRGLHRSHSSIDGIEDSCGLFLRSTDIGFLVIRR